MSCDVGALSVLVQEQLVVRTIHGKIVRPWLEQGELVHCASGMLPTCGVGVGVYCMCISSRLVTNSTATYICVALTTSTGYKPFQKCFSSAITKVCSVSQL